MTIYTKKASKRRNDSHWLTNDGDAKIKKIKFQKKIFGKAAQISAFQYKGEGAGAYIPLYNPNSNPQPANIDKLHIITQYTTHNGQSGPNIKSRGQKPPQSTGRELRTQEGRSRHKEQRGGGLLLLYLIKGKKGAAP